MQNLDPTEYGRQLLKPEGEAGIQMGELMNFTNQYFYAAAFQIIDFANMHQVLEIGFGNGKFFPEYVRANPNIHITGVDFSETMCNEAAKRNADLIAQQKLQIVCENACSTSFSDNSFDAIITINTVYFWQQPDAQIEELKRILRPNGKLLIGFRPRSEMAPFAFTKEVFTLYEAKDVIHLLGKHGFRVLQHESRPVSFKSPEGTDISFTDNCILFERN